MWRGGKLPFSGTERQAMLELKGMGSTLSNRLEQIGFYSLAELKNQDAASTTKQISEMMGLTCWYNSSQARTSIQAVTDLANAKHQYEPAR